MNQSIIPCWWFEGNANEAFEFYTQIFPNSEITYSDNILVEANLMGVKFSGINGGEMNRPNDAISYMITLESKSEIKTIGNHLLENGEVLMPLDSYPWSSYYGWIRDKYGISWQLYLGKLSDVNHQKIAPTLMFGGSQQGNCQSAIDLYSSIFKDYKSQGILRYSEGEMKGQIQHSQFQIHGFTMMAMDSGAPQNITFDEGNYFIILCEDQNEIDYYWESFTKNGTEGQGGWSKDEFGLSWQIIPKNLSEYLRLPANVQQLIKMKKIILLDFIND